MSILAYQEVICRIEELTRCIHELDPYFVMPPPTEEDPAATLAMLVSSGERARQQRRGRSPERRALLPPPPRFARSPAWASGGTTYAEIVKGCNSRSSSVHDRQPSEQRLHIHRMRYETPELRQTEPINISPEEVYSTAIISDVQQCVPNEDIIEKSEPISCGESTYESECNVPFASDTNVYYEQKPVIDKDINKQSSINSKKHYQEETVSQLPEHRQSTFKQNTSSLSPSSIKERSVSPASKYRSQDLSYAEILALGLRKQTSVQNVTILPKPQTAHVEIVKEEVIEEEKKCPNESKLLKEVSLVKREKQVKPIQRSRSRDIQRQRKAPEKSKTLDIQLTKKKKGMKKVIEVESFDDISDSLQLEDISLSTNKTNMEKPKTIEKASLEKLEHISLVFKAESVLSETEKSKTSIQDTLEIEDLKKTKKKSKSRKLKESEDDIEKALKEIEQSDKHKKKKSKQISKENNAELLNKTVSVKTETKSPSSVKLKKKKYKGMEVNAKYNDSTRLPLNFPETNRNIIPSKSSPEARIPNDAFVDIVFEDRIEVKHLASIIDANSSINYTCTNQSLPKDSSTSENVKSKKKKKNKNQDRIKHSNLQNSEREITLFTKPSVIPADVNIIENLPNKDGAETTTLPTEDNQETQESQKDDNGSGCNANDQTNIDMNISNIDWVTLMEEEERMSLKENKDYAVCEEVQEVPEQNINEVLQVLDNDDKTEDITQITKSCQENKYLNQVQASSANEQNNNDKYFSNEKKEDSTGVTTEVIATESSLETEKTHTVYLITHEEKKLPPIRTVKVFRSKSNSLEEYSVNDVETHDTQLLTEEQEYNTLTQLDVIPVHRDNASEKAKCENLTQTEKTVQNILLSATATTTGNESGLEKNYDIIEQAIFGSIQLRKKNEFESNIPYTELVDDNNIDIESKENMNQNNNSSVLYLLEDCPRFSYSELYDAEKRFYSVTSQDNDLNNCANSITLESIKMAADSLKESLNTTNITNQFTENVLSHVPTANQAECLEQGKDLIHNKITEHIVTEHPYYNYADVVDAERLFASNLHHRGSDIPIETCNTESTCCQTSMQCNELRDGNSIKEYDEKLKIENQDTSIKKHIGFDLKEVPQQNYQDIADAENLLGNMGYKQELNISDIVSQPSKENIKYENVTRQLKVNVIKETLNLNYQDIADSEQLLGSLASSKQKSSSFIAFNKFVQQNDNVEDTNTKVICYYEIPNFNYQELCDAEKLLLVCKNKRYECSITDSKKDVEVLTRTSKLPQFEIPTHNYQELIDAEKLQATQKYQNKEKTVIPSDIKKIKETNKKISEIEEDISEVNAPKDKNISEDLMKENINVNLRNERIEVISKDSPSSCDEIHSDNKSSDISFESNRLITDVKNETIIGIMPEKEDDGFVFVEICDLQDEINTKNDYVVEDSCIKHVGDAIQLTDETIEAKSIPISEEKNNQSQSQTATTKIQITSNVQGSGGSSKKSLTNQKAENDYVIISPSENIPSTNKEIELDIVESQLEDKINLLCKPSEIAESKYLPAVNIEALEKVDVPISQEQTIKTKFDSDSIEIQIASKSLTIDDFSETQFPKKNVSNEDSATEYEIIKLPENVPSNNEITELNIVEAEIEDNIDFVPNTTVSAESKSKLTNEAETFVTSNKNEVTRSEKSPIHSLHDLLPEIDSIPEFKPSYNNKALFSNLSADAPEFRPAYLYQTTDTTKCLPKSYDVDSVINICENNTISRIKDSEENLVNKFSHEMPAEKVNTTLENIVPVSPQTSDGKTVSIAMSKVETKKRKRNETPASSHQPEVEYCKNPSTTQKNVWAKAGEEGKSYAKIVAEGLSEYPKFETKTEVSHHATSSSSSKEEINKEDHKVTDTSETWAKIVATHLPSPERLPKVDISIQETVAIQHKSPIIVVEQTENDACKSDLVVDAEGFITVDRSRRSRSKSRTRDINSPLISKTPIQTEARDRSINRFDALVDSLTISDDTSDISNNIQSNEEKVPKKERKSRRKSEESKDKNVSSVKKREKSSKRSLSKHSSRKIDTPVESKETENVMSLATTNKLNMLPTDSQEETQSKKKKNKKKKKDKSVVQSKINATTEKEITVTQKPDIELNVSEYQKQKLISPINTPESIQTPVKERVYSEAQFWKTNPDTYLDLSSTSEVISVEIPKYCIKSNKDMLISVGADLNIDNKILDTTCVEKSETNIKQDKKNTDTKISEEQSLENKMADLQREIEEMLLPENDHSTVSEDFSNELMDLDNSINEQQDELLYNMSPSLASPEPEDSLGSQEELPLVDVMPLSHKKYEPLTNTEKDATPVSSKEVNSQITNNNLLSSTCNLNESFTYNEYVNDRLSNLVLDSFCFRNFAVDDAENLFATQKSKAHDSAIEISKLSVDNKIFIEDQTIETMKNDITDTCIAAALPENKDDYIIRNIFHDKAFWCDKHLYHDAECLFVTSLMNKTKIGSYKSVDEKSKDQSDRDRDPNGSGYSSESEKDTFSSLEPSFDSNYISMDLPGGICSWQDQSSYLSLETPSESTETIIDSSRLNTDISEDTLTNPPLNPVTLSIPIQVPSAEEDGLQKAKDNISNELETLMDEVKIVQANLTDLPNESLQAMERGLVEGTSILIKCEEAAILLEKKIMEYRQEMEVQALLKELVVIKTRITKLLLQARQGIAVIQEAKSGIEKQKEQIEKEKQKVAKLDHWLETINNDLKETANQSDVFSIEDILKYIKIYERYIIEYNEYEMILKSITVINCDDSSQLGKKVIMTTGMLEETKNLVISEIERLKRLLIQIKSRTETMDEELSQTDRTIDSTSMPEEIVSPREIEKVSEIIEPNEEITTKEIVEKEIEMSHEILDKKAIQNLQTANIETQTGRSLAIDPVSAVDKSTMCQPNKIDTHNVAISCIPLQDVEIQTSENSQIKDSNLLQHLKICQTNTEDEQRIEISSKPIISSFPIGDENTVVVNADYKDGDNYKTSEINISHTVPQSFETIMVEPDETTTEVVVDADGTKKIIVKKIKRSMITRHHLIHSQNEPILFDTQNPNQQFSQIILASDKGIVSDVDVNSKQVQYESYGSHIISGIPDSEVTIQEVTSKPDTLISLEKDLNPDEIFRIADNQLQPIIQTSSSSVTAVVQQVTKRIVKTKRRIIRRVVIIDGKEQVSEEIVEEPDDIEITEEQIPRVSITVKDDKTKEDLELSGNDDYRPITPSEEKQSGTASQNQENIIDKSKKIELNMEKKSTVIDTDSNVDIMNVSKEVKTEITSILDKTESSPRHSAAELEHSSMNLKILDTGTNFHHVTDEIIDEPGTTTISKEPVLAFEVKSEIGDTKPQLPSKLEMPEFTENQTLSSNIPDSLNKTSDTMHIPEKMCRIDDTEPYINNTTTVRNIVDNFLTSERVVENKGRCESPYEVSGCELPSNLDRDQVEFVSANTTNIQQVTRTICRTRKRVIQHVNIVDGKEHITEEFIEEPEEIEVIKEDPVITEETANQVFTDAHQDKPTKVIRQIRVVDGKQHITEKILDETGDEPFIQTPSVYSQTYKIEDIGNTERSIYGDKKDSPKVEIIGEYIVQDSETLPVILSQSEKSNVQLIDTNILTSQKITRTITTTKKRVIKHITIVDGKEHVTEEVIEEPDNVEIVEVPPETENIKVKRVKVVRQVKVINGKEQVMENVIEESDDEGVPDQVSIFPIENVEKDTSNIDYSPYENILQSHKQVIENIETKDENEVTSDKFIAKEGVDNIQETSISDVSVLETNIDSKLYDKTNVIYQVTEESASNSISSETSTQKKKRSKKDKKTLEKGKEIIDSEKVKKVSKKKVDDIEETSPLRGIEKSDEIIDKLKDEIIIHNPLNLPKSDKSYSDEIHRSVVSSEPAITSETHITEDIDNKINKTEVKDIKQDSNIILSFIDNEKLHSEMLISGLASDAINIPDKKYKQSGTKQVIQTHEDKSEDFSNKIKMLQVPNTVTLINDTVRDGENLNVIDTSVEITDKNLVYISPQSDVEIVDDMFKEKIDIGKENVDKSKNVVSIEDISVDETDHKNIDISNVPSINKSLNQIKISNLQPEIPLEVGEILHTAGTSDLTLTTGVTETIICDSDIFNKTTSNLKQDTQILLDVEKQNTNPQYTTQKLNDSVINSQLKSQTVDISMSLAKTNENVESKVKVDLKIQDVGDQKSVIVKKDISVDLPVMIKMTESEYYEKDSKQDIISDDSSNKKTKKRKKSKKRLDDSPSSNSEIEPVMQSTADITFIASGSSSLSHYVELPTPTTEDSSKPKGDITVEPSADDLKQEDSLSLESKPPETEKGYEPDDTSVDVEPLRVDKKGKLKKRKPHGESEDTAYPKTTTPESETSQSPPKIKETVSNDKKPKKGKKKYSSEKQTKHNEGIENITSPKDESCHTLTDTSDVNTVKIVEECVNSSPEILTKRDFTATLAYPVPVLEEVQIQEFSSQTSPDLGESKNEENCNKTCVELVDSELQTSPMSTKETISQTTPINDVENYTQTSDDLTLKQTVELLSSEAQTSRIQTPDPIITSEVMTQIESKDIIPQDDKISQTVSSTITDIQLEVRETQTSPTSKVTYEEKYTEIVIPTEESGTVTEKQDNVDQQTATSPCEMEIVEMSVQTSDVPLVSTHTQSETFEENNAPSSPTSPQIREIITSERCQQTSPMDTSIMDIKIISAKMIDSEQQTTPRDDVSKLNENTSKDSNTLVSTTQQTSPRMHPQTEHTLEFIKIVEAVDQNQQTSPRELYEDTTSTSTDEPYEVHLRAQISVPQASINFVKNEREPEEVLDSIIGDTHKQKRRRQKKKAESPLKSPGSLSDPVNTELSLSASPTSGDLSSKDISSIDEGISQHGSPVTHVHDDKNIALAKLSYSDVVQRSKSKSPSPSKTILAPRTGKAKLLDALEKRTKLTSEPSNTYEDSMTVALFEPSVEKSYDLIINKELDVVKNALQSNDSSQVESSVIVIIETISIWLEEIQSKIQTNTLSGILILDESERIKTLETYIKNLKEIVTVTEIRTETREEVITLIETLSRQVRAVSNLSNQSNEKVQELENNWGKFLSDLDKLYNSIYNVKSSLDNLVMTETTTQQKLEYLDKIESENVENMTKIKKMFCIYKKILESNPKKDCPTHLYTCDDCSRQIENTINTERDRLLQLASLAEEYEQTLQDFGQITDVAEALLDGKIVISNLDHLHEEIQKHRKFFVNLSHCRAILESLEDNLDNETRAKYTSLHHSLHDRATAIIDRAAGRAQQMTLAASRWRLLDQSMKEEQQWLRVAQQRIPDVSNVTSMDYEQYINLYQSISLDVSQHYAKILRLISITEGIQSLITCSGLETDCSLALDTLLKLQEEVDSSLTRLIAFKENWSTYDHLVDRIEGWIKLGNRELETITPENITTTANLRRFWELKAQHEVHNNLKTDSGVQFEKALEILPISDEMVQRQFFSNIEDKWRALSKRIGSLHAAAIQNISDRDVSTGEKLYILEDEIRELRAVLDSLKGVIKSDDELNLYIERLQVMGGRIDRIQNELGRLSLLPTAESERLGALLTQSGMLSDQFAEELEKSLLLKEKILQVKAGIARCQKSQRRAKLTLEECEAGERLGSDVVERASQTCDKLVEDLSLQWKDILALRQALHTLPTTLRVSVSPLSIERDISALQETHSELENACTDLSVRLRARLQLWRRFERQLELVQGAVREADYMVELLTVQGQVDYDRLLKATEKLETLSESLTRRNGELVGSLRSAAEPLQATCEASVAMQLQRELDDATATYEHTCANLTTLCDKYQKAVELWKRYRDAAAVVRAFAEQQEGSLHALRPDDAPATAEACLEQEARVAELRSLAARVAAETGSRALQTDADALARRLQLVAGAVQALADLGEARQLARAKAQHAKEKFCDMRQDLTPVHEEGEIVEDKLIALRDNLIALGKSEADIASAKAELPDIDRDVSDEHSIVRILELWQAMFRDTFLHYHRLSTALVRSGDAATALKLWHEYLLDLQSFLSGTVPADYENLTEHRRLCRVHRNLLASQRSVLINENKESKNQNLTDKFDTLTNLHNETLARIVERHDEVCTRIATWDSYRSVYTEILQWLKEIEREKEKLQLRYVHIKRIHKTLNKIQNLSDKLPEGRKRLEKLFGNLKKVLIFTEETYGASVRMEYAGIVKRVDNLQASLDTWRDFLTRILGLIGEYDNLTSDLQKLYNKSQLEISTYSDEERLSRPQLKKALERYTELRTKINKTETRLEGLSVIQEQLKECLSPQDIRIVNQKVWQLRQQQADLEHQLSIIIHKIQERLEIYSVFDTRLTRFTEWITTLETRLETCSSSGEVALDPQDLLRRINSDIQAETSLKEREFEWLTQTGPVLIDVSKKDEKSYSKNISKQLKDVQERWHKLQETGRSRITKINELLETIIQLEETLTEIRLKLHTIESQLTTTVILEQLTTKAVDSQFQARDKIHKCIETESEVVGKNLNLCELVFNDPDVAKGNFDLRNLHTGVDIVDKKWKNICDLSEHRKNTLKEIRKSAELSNSLLPKVEKKLDSIEKRVEKIETRKQRGETEDESVSKAVTKDLDNLEGDVKRLEDAYSRIASARGVELRGAAADDAARLRAAVRKHQQLRGRVDAAGADVHRRFIAAHGKAVVALAEADVRLTRALHLAPMPLDKVATLKELDGVERDLAECHALVEEADRLAGGAAAAGGSVADMRAEYRALYADVRTRLGVARADVGGDVDTAVQVDTLRWETDAELQVDTLTSKETYRVELTAAVQETSESLEALRNILAYEIKDNTSGDELATAAKEVAKAGAKPGQTLELAKHLSELLLTECDATEDEAMLKEVESLSLRYEELLNQAKKRELQINNLRLPHSASYALTCEHESGKLTCPLCSDRNWKQLDNDLWRLEQWLQYAEATDEARTDPPEDYDALEDAITDHREFLLDLDSHKSLVVSLNVVGSHVTRHARDADAATRAQARLAAANARWDAACARAGAWQTRLQEALVHSRQFHDAVVALVAQLASAERLVRAREPLRLTRPAADLRRDFRRFSELRDELSRAEPRVLALRDAAHLLRATDEHDLYTRLGELRLRLQSLRKLSAVYALKLGAALARAPPDCRPASALAAVAAAAAPQLMEDEEEQISTMNLPPLDENDVMPDDNEERSLSGVRRGLRFVCRVARASLPFQALLLLLLGAAALAPTAHDCRAPPSLAPVLRYPHGPPPL